GPARARRPLAGGDRPVRLPRRPADAHRVERWRGDDRRARRGGETARPFLPRRERPRLRPEDRARYEHGVGGATTDRDRRAQPQAWALVQGAPGGRGEYSR